MTSHFPNRLRSERRPDERRRADWQQNDRRQKWPWVVDINDRRSGVDRRLEQQIALEHQPTWASTAN